MSALTFFSHRLNSSSVQVSGAPVGSFSAGNISPPKIVDIDANATRPANPKNKFRDCSALSMAVGIVVGNNAI